MDENKVVRVLSLDGGGVRGLSALIILKKLLCIVNEELDGATEPIPAKDIFDVIVGTSTGGLIALMMVKLDMSVDECIDQYKILSGQIFGRPHFIGKRTLGFGTTKYSGTRLRKFVVELIKERKKLSEEQATDFEIENDDGYRGTMCTVVCRELENNWTKTWKDEPVFLCSHRCREPPNPYSTCKMCDAARATSAAPTYFPEVQIMNKVLVDGGYGYTNNPSADAWDHYRIENRSWSVTSKNSPIVWVNIGTGKLPEGTSPRDRPRPLWTYLIPNYLLNIYHLTRDLQKIATNSEQVASQMKRLARETKDRVQFSRYSADNGLHSIQLDGYESIDDGTIEKLTEQYLEKEEVLNSLRETAQSLAASCRLRRTASRTEDQARLAATQPSQQATTSRPTRIPTVTPLVTIEQSETAGESALVTPTTTDVPDLSGRSEPTAEDRSEEIITPGPPPPAELDGTSATYHPPIDENDVDAREADRLGVGDQFTAPPAVAFRLPHLTTPTPNRQPKRSSTLPARLDGSESPI